MSHSFAFYDIFGRNMFRGHFTPTPVAGIRLIKTTAGGSTRFKPQSIRMDTFRSVSLYWSLHRPP